MKRDENVELLTGNEVATLLRLDDRKRPLEAVRYLRRTHQLRAVQVAGRWRYRRRDVLDYVRQRPVSEVLP